MPKWSTTRAGKRVPKASMRKITTTIATLIALVGGAQASEPLIPFPNLKPHSTCIEIVSR
jgi:hypothetical protein